MKSPAAEDPVLTPPIAGRRRSVSVAARDLVEVAPLVEGRTLPLAARPAVEGVDLLAWAGEQRQRIHDLLLSHGGILFRGFGVRSEEGFEQILRAVTGELLDYTYRSTPRSNVSGRIYTSTEYPADQWIPLHNELAYSRRWPLRIGFCCLVAPEEGGETPIADSRRVYQQISTATRQRFAERGVMYVRNYGEGLDLTWQEVFQTSDRSAVEAFCRDAGIEIEWKGADRVRTRQVCQAVAAHPETGEPVWFNQAHLFHVSSLAPQVRQALLRDFAADELPRNAYYGDGSEIEDEGLAEVREAYRRESVIFPWQQGDVLMLDNMLSAHGRAPFKGARRIVVGMGEAIGAEGGAGRR